MSIFKCKMCGGTLEINEKQSVAVCEYCGTQQTLPNLDDDRRAQMYDRANHYRRNDEFDKAMGIYEKILNEDNTDAEAYWSLVLCRYGIEYVEDPSTHKRVPTVNRAQFTSIFDDADYKSALQYADGYQKTIYENEAQAINEIQKGILAISQKEEPFDVFICYKETDNSGRRTRDSVLANDLYHQLTQEGFKVFFSRITLEDKLGTAYEPYIFAALNSAKVMVVIGTKPEYFNAVWVKNEWSRYLSLIKSGEKKVLIPAYRDMDPYDLPEEFSHLQAQDMGKLGFMQDLIRGIKKLVESDAPKADVKETVIVNSGSTANVDSLLKRAFMYLEDGDWNSADEYCERILDIEPENSRAYLGKLMAEFHARNANELIGVSEPFYNNANYEKALRFADDELKAKIKDLIYRNAIGLMKSQKDEETYREAAKRFKQIAGYKDADALAKECLEKAEALRKDKILAEAEGLSKKRIPDLQRAISLCESISGWKNADELRVSCKKRIEEIEAERQLKKENLEKSGKKTIKIASIVISVIVVAVVALIVSNFVIKSNKYNEAVSLMNEGKYQEAREAFIDLDGYMDSEEKASEAYKQYKHEKSIDLLEKGNVFGAIAEYAESGYMKDNKINSIWREYCAQTVSTGIRHTVALKSNGTVVAVGDNGYGQCDVSGWRDIVSVSAGQHYTVGLKSDGTVVAVGNNKYGQCNVSDWSDIVSISTSGSHTVGLKSDGTVVAVGLNDDGQCDVSGWSDIVAVSVGDTDFYYSTHGYTIGLKSDGTAVATTVKEKRCDSGQCDVSGWSDIVSISTSGSHTVGLKSDGTVVAVGENIDGQCDVSGWRDIVAVSAGRDHTVGLKSDGTVVAVGRNYNGQCDVSGWRDIVAVSAGRDHTVGLKSDGTVVATTYTGDSEYYYGQCNVSGWNNIKVPKK